MFSKTRANTIATVGNWTLTHLIVRKEDHVDRRIAKTQNALLTAMIGLLGKQDWGQINVQQICDAADIARSTFYSHFNNKQELFDFGFAQLTQQMGSHVEGRGLEQQGKFQFLPELIQHIKSHQHFFEGDLNQQSGKMILEKFKHLVQKQCCIEFKETSHQTKLNAAELSFISCGVFGVIEAWCLGYCKEEIDDVINSIDKIVSKFV